MKKKLPIILSLFVLVIIFSGCVSTPQTTDTGLKKKQPLTDLDVKNGISNLSEYKNYETEFGSKGITWEIKLLSYADYQDYVKTKGVIKSERNCGLSGGDVWLVAFANNQRGVDRAYIAVIDKELGSGTLYRASIPNVGSPPYGAYPEHCISI